MDTTSTRLMYTGIVCRKTAGGYSVQVDDRRIECALSNKLAQWGQVSRAGVAPKKRTARKDKPVERTDSVAVGDAVQLIDARDGSGMIVDRLPRRNQLSRRSAAPMPSARPFEQVIAANVDRVVPVFAAAQPEPKWHLLDRYLVSAEAAGLAALICITKSDLIRSEEERQGPLLSNALQVYQEIGYPLILTSARTGEGLDELRQALQDATSVLVGKSGVGKTSLLNALQPDLGLRVKEVNPYTGKGKHTTSHAEMFALEFGGAIIDTPGVHEFGLRDLDGLELAACFPEMRPYLGQCKFGLDCRHDQEPGCEIRNAVVAGKISPYRYKSLMRLMVEP